VFSEGFAVVCNDDDKWGYIDESGAEVIPCKFDEAYGFARDGLATVVVNEKTGFIDKTGAFVIEPMYDVAYDFSGALAEVEFEGSEAYIIRKGDLVWPIFTKTT